MSLEQDINSVFPGDRDIPHELVSNLPIEQGEYLIDGALRHWKGAMKEVYSPIHVRNSKGLFPKLLGQYPLLTEAESMAALDSAMIAVKADVVNLLMWEIGKSYADSYKEFDRTVQYIKDTIAALKDLDRVSSRFVIEQGIIGQIRRAPLGVALCIGPFNYPLNETFTTLIPALIMGNSVVLKPPKHGVLLYGCLLEAFCDSFPKGVVNTIYGKGREVLPPLMASGKINVLAFIGTGEAANQLRKQYPKLYRLRCILGLEAKNPGIILPDADLALAVKECILGCLSFNGQRCTALKILFVHSEIVDAFLDRFVEAIKGLELGMPWEENVFITPLPETGKTQYLTELMQDSFRLGAKVVNDGGGTVNESFIYPAVLYPVSDKMRIFHEEQFGPLIPVVPFDDVETPIHYVIESKYGQQLSVFGSDPDVIAHLIDPLVNQVCRVNINSQCQRSPDTFPFTGRKDSAEGTLSVSDALRVFSIRTLVAAKEIDLNKEIITTIVRQRKSNFLSTDFIL